MLLIHFVMRLAVIKAARRMLEGLYVLPLCFLIPRL